MVNEAQRKKAQEKAMRIGDDVRRKRERLLLLEKQLAKHTALLYSGQTPIDARTGQQHLDEIDRLEATLAKERKELLDLKALERKAVDVLTKLFDD